jgi:NAD(P)-dependent dehydrogenase (short-subunit alcohol dehydrogenase family)
VKVALITGAGGAIGKATAQKFIDQGYFVIGQYNTNKNNIDDFIKVFEAAEQSPFLRGEKSTGEHANWKATIDFLLREDKFVAALEGQYMDFGPANNQNKVAAQLDNEYEDIRRWAEAGDQYG